jgi:hypothetical protein
MPFFYFIYIGFQDRIEWLETLVEYYKKDNYNFIYPNEAPKDPKEIIIN